MATDATGTPTALGIPKYNTSADAPSGLGFNAAMDTIDTLIAARLKVTGAPADADVPVWDSASSTWKPSSTKTPSVGATVRLFDTILGADSASVDISSISQAYAHLQLIVFARSSVAGSGDTLLVRLNNDTTVTSYASEETAAIGPATTTLAETFHTVGALRVGTIPDANARANSFGSNDTLIPYYTNTANIKTTKSVGSHMQTSATGGFRAMTAAGFYESLSAITRITVFAGSGNLKAGSRVTLYGLS